MRKVNKYATVRETIELTHEEPKILMDISTWQERFIFIKKEESEC